MNCRSDTVGDFSAAKVAFEDKWLAGWTVTSIVTLQSGFPFTPQLGYNPSNDGDTRNPVRPFS